jgi:hypothetical protein
MEDWESINFEKLTEGEVVILLRKPWIPKDFFYNLLGRKDLVKFYSVQKEIVNHPCSPQDISLNILPNLLPIDLLRVAKNLRVSPFLRRQAETIFLQKWSKIPLGEKISHARRATPFILKNLKSEQNRMVIKALLENPSLTEEILLELINSPKISINVIEEIFNSHWRNRYRIKFAIVRCPETPVQLVLRILPELHKGDLLSLLKEPIPSLIKNKILEITKEENQK